MKTVLFGLLAIFLVGVGFVLGMWSQSESQVQPVVLEADPLPTAESAHRASSPEQTDCPAALARTQAKVDAWEAKAKVQGWILGNVQAALGEYEKTGSEPVPWDEATPPAYRALHFERVMSEAVAQAGAGIEYLGARCEEAPCIAFLRVEDLANEAWLGRLQGTPAWSESYDNLISSWGTKIECEDGRKEHVVFLSKAWPELSDAEWLHIKKRHPKRIDAYSRQWKCQGE